MTKRKIIGILKFLGYTQEFDHDWSYRQSLPPSRKASVRFSRFNKVNRVKLGEKTYLVEDLTKDELFDYILTKLPELKSKIRQYKINQVI